MMFPISPNGRWRGNLTARPLPTNDPELDALDDGARRELARVWWMQAATEARVAKSFAVVHSALSELNADSELINLAERAIDDEHRHANLCLALANRIAGFDLGEVAQLPEQQPQHPEARSAQERNALFVVGQCALNETFANGYLTLAHHQASTPVTRAALQELIRDEIDHARLGWAYLSTMSLPMRKTISTWLVPLTAANLREWRSSTAHPNLGLEAYGVPHSDAIRASLDEVVREVLLPGFAHIGLDVRELERWARQGMPTPSRGNERTTL